MERQLAEYRARKAKEKRSEEQSSTFSSARSNFTSLFSRQNVRTGQADDGSHTPAAPAQPQHTAPPRPSTQHSRTASLVHTNTHILTHPTFLKAVLWLILWGLFLELGFGAVYFVISLLFIVYKSTRTGPQAESGAPSAYSVFNPNCERLEGTFTAEQFEKELRHGAGSVH